MYTADMWRLPFVLMFLAVASAQDQTQQPAKPPEPAAQIPEPGNAGNPNQILRNGTKAGEDALARRAEAQAKAEAMRQRVLSFCDAAERDQNNAERKSTITPPADVDKGIIRQAPGSIDKGISVRASSPLCDLYRNQSLGRAPAPK